MHIHSSTFVPPHILASFHILYFTFHSFFKVSQLIRRSTKCRYDPFSSSATPNFLLFRIFPDFITESSFSAFTPWQWKWTVEWRLKHNVVGVRPIQIWMKLSYSNKIEFPDSLSNFLSPNHQITKKQATTVKCKYNHTGHKFSKGNYRK